MLKNFFIMSAFAMSTICQASGLAVKVTNIQLARAGMVSGGRPVYLQNGNVHRPDKIDYSRTYCFAWSNHFQVWEQKLYPVTKIETEQKESVSISIRLSMNTQSSDPMALFSLSCTSSTTLTLEQVSQALAGIYQIVPQ